MRYRCNGNNGSLRDPNTNRKCSPIPHHRIQLRNQPRISQIMGIINHQRPIPRPPQRIPQPSQKNPTISRRQRQPNKRLGIPNKPRHIQRLSRQPPKPSRPIITQLSRQPRRRRPPPRPLTQQHRLTRPRTRRHQHQRQPRRPIQRRQQPRPNHTTRRQLRHQHPRTHRHVDIQLRVGIVGGIARFRRVGRRGDVEAVTAPLPPRAGYHRHHSPARNHDPPDAGPASPVANDPSGDLVHGCSCSGRNCRPGSRYRPTSCRTNESPHDRPDLASTRRGRPAIGAAHGRASGVPAAQVRRTGRADRAGDRPSRSGRIPDRTHP